MKAIVDECVSGKNANMRRSTHANTGRKYEKEECSSEDDAMCFGKAKCANKPMIAERVSGTA